MKIMKKISRKKTPLPLPGRTAAKRIDINQNTLYEKLVEHMNEIVWMVDERQRTMYVNPKFTEVTGYALKDVLGKDSYGFLDDGSKRSLDEVENLRKKGISSSYEASIITKGGKRIPVLVSGTPIADGWTVGIMTDLRAVKEQESLYRKLVENMNEAVWMLSPEQKTVYVNPKFCEIMGYTQSEMLGRDCLDFMDDPSKEIVRREDAKRAKGISSSYEVTLVSKSGTFIPVLISGTPLPEGGTIGIMTDLRELKRRAEKERVLSGAVSYATDGIIIADHSGKVESWNKGAKIIFGYTEDEMMNSDLQNIFSSEDIHSMLNNEKVRYNFELHAQHKNRQEIIISATVSPIMREERHGGSFFLLIARDITAQRKFEEELSVKYQKMRDAYNQFGIVRRQMDYIFDLADICRQSGDVMHITDFIVNSVIMLTRVDACILRLYNEEKGTLELASCFGVTDEWRSKSSLALKDSVVERAFQQGAPVKIVDITREPRYPTPHLARKHNFSSLFSIPLTFQGKLVGSLALYVCPDKKLELFENEFIEDYAKIIGIILARTRKNTGNSRESAGDDERLI